MRRTSCSSLSRVFSTRSSCLPHLRLLHRYRRTMKILLMCPATTRSENMSEQAQGDLIQTQSQDDEQARGDTVTAWIAMRKSITGKEFTLTSWTTEIAKCRRARTTWTLCKRRTGEAIPRAAKFGRIDNSRAQSLNWDLWFGKQSPIRYRGTKFGSWKIRDETKLLGADKEAKSHLHWQFLGVWHKSVKLTMELLKSIRRHLTVQKDLGTLNSGMLNRGEVLCIAVAVDQSTVKIGRNDENLPFKIKWDCWIAVRWMEEGTFA